MKKNQKKIVAKITEYYWVTEKRTFAFYPQAIRTKTKYSSR